jgi:putative endonuclease
MNTKQNIGMQGEALAKAHCEQLGYEIMEENYRFGRHEIDLIALDGSLLIFIEVKTRSSTKYGYPEEAVSDAKIASIKTAAEEYMYQLSYEKEIRFDIISIILQNGNIELEHIKDAFF